MKDSLPLIHHSSFRIQHLSSRVGHCVGLLNPMSRTQVDRKSTRLNSSHGYISYAVFCLKKKNDTDAHNSCFALHHPPAPLITTVKTDRHDLPFLTYTDTPPLHCDSTHPVTDTVTDTPR